MRKEVERMKRLLSLVGILALLGSMIPAIAVEFSNVSITFEVNGIPVRCPQNDTYVNMTVRFELNSTFPDTYTIWVVPQPIVESNFNFTEASLIAVSRDSIDQTNNATVQRKELGLFVVYINEGESKTLTGNHRFELLIGNVKTPPEPGNYTFALGLKDASGNIQYGESAIVKGVCLTPVIPTVPEPRVKPCECEYKVENNTIMKAVPEACFKLEAPYEDGMVFKGFKMFVDGEPYLITDYWTEYSTECLREDTTTRPAVGVFYDFAIGTHGWTSEGDWEWGQPYDLIDVCPGVVASNAWGLKTKANYTAGNVVYNLTSPQLGGCNFNGTVLVGFRYSAYLEDGDMIVVEGWNGTDWVEITTISGPMSVCNGLFTGSFDMNASGEWKTYIRFRFVGDGDEFTDYGFYIHDLWVYSEDECEASYCAEFKPEYYYTNCQCLEYYVDIELNDEHVVKAEAIYYVNDTQTYENRMSDELVIRIDNTPPAITAQDTPDSIIFSIRDNIVGVEANSDSEPIKVKYKDVGFDFKRWPIYDTGDGSYYYYYELYDPEKQTRSVAVHFDRLELGNDELYIYGGCYNCEIFYYWDCGYWLYIDWSSDYYYPICVKSAWVRVPLNDCEMNCTELGVCENCDYREGCDDCAKIEFYDNRFDSAFGISIDMLVYGTGIMVLKNGMDITSQCTITSDGFNATVEVPESLLNVNDEIVVVATDKVGNANYYRYIFTGAPPTTPTPGSPSEPWENYDSNNDGTIDDSELIQAILDWLNGTIGDADLINVILKWLG